MNDDGVLSVHETGPGNVRCGSCGIVLPGVPVVVSRRRLEELENSSFRSDG